MNTRHELSNTLEADFEMSPEKHFRRQSGSVLEL
jgi:hypothetical protein